jgi:perosamine synthetase
MIQHNKPVLDELEEIAAARVLRSSWLVQGAEVEAFEKEFCDFIDLPHGHAIAVANGTSALYLALTAIGAKGKIIAFPAYVCSALRNAVGFNNAIEELVDNDINSANLSIGKLNASKSSIAIVPHTYGIPVDINKIKNKIIIEDCCQALGAKLYNKSAGTIGDIGVYSFYASKLITSGGQGGMIVSKDKAFIDIIKDIREFDKRNDSKIRFNFQITDLQAAIGRVQLQKLPKFIKRRQEIFDMYQDAGFNLFDSDNQQLNPVRYRAVLKTPNSEGLQQALLKKNIKTIIPLEDWELLGNSKNFVNAHAFTRASLSLPIYPSLSDTQIKYIIQNIKDNL